MMRLLFCCNIKVFLQMWCFYLSIWIYDYIYDFDSSCVTFIVLYLIIETIFILHCWNHCFKKKIPLPDLAFRHPPHFWPHCDHPEKPACPPVSALRGHQRKKSFPKEPELPHWQSGLLSSGTWRHVFWAKGQELGLLRVKRVEKSFCLKLRIVLLHQNCLLYLFPIYKQYGCYITVLNVTFITTQQELKNILLFTCLLNVLSEPL